MKTIFTADDFEMLKDSVSIVDIANDLQLNPDETTFDCPNCKDRAQYSKENQIYHCFSCNKGGNSILLVRAKNGGKIHDAVNWIINEHLGIKGPN